MKRFLSIILASILLFSTLPLTAVAADTDEVQTPEKSEVQEVANDDADTVDEAGVSFRASDELADTGAAEELVPISVGPDKYSGMTGSCRWELTPNDGLLHIYTSGNNGQIYDYTESDPAPWYNYRNYIKTLWIENKVTSIGNYSFYGCTNLTTVSLPSTINHLGTSAFNYCTSLKSISLASTSIDAIFSNTFYNCNSLPSCALPTTLKWIGSSAFEKCYSLESMTIPQNVESIGDRAFMNCNVMNPVNMNSKLREIGNYAFAYCFALESIDIPSSIDSDIGDWAFQFCSSLKNVNFHENDNYYNIGGMAFYGCGSLTEIEIPSCVINIYPYAFQNCTSLEDITFNYGLVEIFHEAFKGCISLTSIDLPSSVRYIEYNAFERCTSLQSFWMYTNSQVSQGIGDYVFKDCTSLTLAYLPALSVISAGTFMNCSALQSIDLYYLGVETIESNAFYGCTSLKKVRLPDEIECIEEDAFTGCPLLLSLAFDENIDKLEPYSIGYASDENGYEKTKNFTIYGYAGTEPERYADKYGFAFVPYNIVGSVSVSGIVTPVAGDHPSTSASVPAGKGYKVSDKYFDNPTVYWYDEEEEEYLGENDVFEASKDYTVEIYLRNSEEKYRFRAYGFTATLNGITKGITLEVEPRLVRLRYTFHTPAKVVTSVSVSSLNEPSAGAKPDVTALLPLNSGYKLDPDYYASGIGWFDEDDFYMNPANNERFVEGKTYTLRVQLIPTKGYEFTNSGLTATINGSNVGVTLVEPRKKILLSATYTCSGGGTIITGAKISGTVTSFLDSDGKVNLKLESMSLGGSSTVVGEMAVYGNSTYQFTGLNLNGFYKLTVSKANHVTRTYNVVAGSNAKQDVKIHPKGDINGDGKVNTRDFGMAYAHAQKLKDSELTGYALQCADVVKNDGKVTTSDAARINAHIQKADPLW